MLQMGGYTATNGGVYCYKWGGILLQMGGYTATNGGSYATNGGDYVKCFSNTILFVVYATMLLTT